MNKPATLLGLGIGDALGNPFEMKPADDPSLLAWDGLFKAGGTFWKGEAGQYTDDGMMTLCLSASLLDKGGFDPEDVASKYLAWYQSGNTRGIGNTTAAAMENLKHGANWTESGLIHQPDGSPAGGNGTAMRAAPLGLFYRNDPLSLIKFAMMDASITHNADEPKMGSVAVALAISFLVNGTHTPYSALEDVKDILSPSELKGRLLLVQTLLEDAAPATEALAQLGTGGYVVETVAAAFYCVCSTNSFQDAVVMAVRGGGDTDTIGAIVGAFAGSYYGIEGVPGEYKDQVENGELLQLLTDELVNNGI